MARIAGRRADPESPVGASSAVRRFPGRPRLRYERAMDVVETLIGERGLRPGDLLPPGHEIARLAAVSLISVRRALDELERVGRVVRHQGVGTFVGAPRIVTEPGRLGGLLDTLTRRQGPGVLTTALVTLEQGVPNAAIREALDLREGELVWHIVRLRRIGDRAHVLERSALPVAAVPELNREWLEAGGSLYGYLETRYGLHDDFEEQFLHVGTPTPAERRALELRGRQPVVRLRGVSFATGGTAFDCFEQIYPAAAFVFYISGQAPGHLVASADLEAWSVEPVRSRAVRGVDLPSRHA